jgi:hypothetical protein
MRFISLNRMIWLILQLGYEVTRLTCRKWHSCHILRTWQLFSYICHVWDHKPCHLSRAAVSSSLDYFFTFLNTSNMSTDLLNYMPNTLPRHAAIRADESVVLNIKLTWLSSIIQEPSEVLTSFNQSYRFWDLDRGRQWIRSHPSALGATSVPPGLVPRCGLGRPLGSKQALIGLNSLAHRQHKAGWAS